LWPFRNVVVVDGHTPVDRSAQIRMAARQWAWLVICSLQRAKMRPHPSAGRVAVAVCTAMFLAASPARAACRLVSSNPPVSTYTCDIASDADFRDVATLANTANTLVGARLIADVLLLAPVALDRSLSLDFGGRTLNGTIVGAGTLYVSGGATLLTPSVVPLTLAPSTTVRLGGTVPVVHIDSGRILVQAVATATIGVLDAAGGCLICPNPPTTSLTLDTNGHDLLVQTLNAGPNTSFGKIGSGTLIVQRHTSFFTPTFSVMGGFLEIRNDTWQYLWLDGGGLRACASLSVGAGLAAVSYLGNGDVVLGANNGTFDTNGYTLTVRGLSGPGGYTKIGAGTLVVDGTSTYGGATTIASGTMRVASSRALPATTDLTIGEAGVVDGGGQSLSVVTLNGGGRLLIDGGSMAVTGSGASIFSGSIEGNGRFVQSGSGTVTLLGANTYTGRTTVASGTLVGTAASLHGAIDNQSTLVFDQGNSGTFDGAIGGNGIVRKSGGGALIFAQPQRYTGTTQVSAGQLFARDLAGSVAVSTGAAFASSGAVAGDLALAPGATLMIDGSSTDVPVLAVGGRATVQGAQVALSGAVGGARIRTMPFLRANGGISGAFADVNGGAGVDGIVRTAGTTAFLVLERTDVPLAGLARTAAARSAAAAFDSIRAGRPQSADLRQVFREVGALSDSDVSDAFDQLAGGVAQTALGRAALDGQDVLRVVNDRSVDVRSIAGERGGASGGSGGGRATGVWVRTIGSLGTPDDRALTGGLAGAVAGVDRRVAERWLVGAFAGYDRTNVDADASTLLDRRYRFGGTSSVTLGRGFVAGAVSGAVHRFETTRRLAFAAQVDSALGGGALFGGIDRLASARYTGGEATGYVEAGLSAVNAAFAVQPLAGFDVSRVWSAPFFETGAGGVGLVADAARTFSVRPALGIRVLRRSTRFAPRGEVRYLHEVADRDGSDRVAWADAAAAAFSVSGPRVPANATAASAGLAAAARGRLLASVDYHGWFGDGIKRSTLTLGLSF
jgi:fibronectin-binding autotransporter adhesin